MGEEKVRETKKEVTVIVFHEDGSIVLCPTCRLATTKLYTVEIRKMHHEMGKKLKCLSIKCTEVMKQNLYEEKR